MGGAINYGEARQLAEGRLKLAAEATKTAERRLRAIVKKLQAADGELAALEAEIEEAIEAGRSVKKLRDRRRQATEAVEDLRADRRSLAAHLDKRKGAERDVELQRAVARRGEIQSQAAEVGRGMINFVALLDELFDRWKVLRDKDSQAANIIRSIDREKVGALPTYGWASNVDQGLVKAIEHIIKEGARARSLRKAGMSKSVRSHRSRSTG